jgi:cytochrome c biogenesis protein CcdA
MTPGLSLVTLGTTFLAGGLSFLSPCVRPLVPGNIFYDSGRSLSSCTDVRALRPEGDGR